MVVDRPCVVGSAPEVDVRLASPEVSRLHARLEPCDDGLWIEDLASTNGTFVDGVRVRAARIHPGARVCSVPLPSRHFRARDSGVSCTDGMSHAA